MNFKQKYALADVFPLRKVHFLGLGTFVPRNVTNVLTVMVPKIKDLFFYELS